MLEILKYIAALATIATGLYALVAPLKVRGFTGLELPGRPRDHRGARCAGWILYRPGRRAAYLCLKGHVS